jgi:membrane protein
VRRGRPFSATAVGRLFAATFLGFRRDNAGRLAAALSYYTLFSIPPFLILILGVAGSIFDRNPVQERLVHTARDLVGPDGAGALRELLRAVTSDAHHTRTTIVGIATLLFGASGVFGHLKESLDQVWGIEPKPARGVLSYARQYLFSMMALLGTGFLLFLSLALNAILAAVGDWVGGALPGGAPLWRAVNLLVFLAVIAVLFALLFRYVPDAVVTWKDSLVGGGVTSVLFMAGESLIGLYLGRTHVASAFGVAGSLVILLVWVYYSSMIFFFGAEFTKAYADRYGNRILPAGHAVAAATRAR